LNIWFCNISWTPNLFSVDCSRLQHGATLYSYQNIKMIRRFYISSWSLVLQKKLNVLMQLSVLLSVAHSCRYHTSLLIHRLFVYYLWLEKKILCRMTSWTSNMRYDSQLFQNLYAMRHAHFSSQLKNYTSHFYLFYYSMFVEFWFLQRHEISAVGHT
jgi:hypothetical protein